MCCHVMGRMTTCVMAMAMNGGVTDYLKTDLVLQTFCVRLQTNVSYRTFANHCHGFANKHGNSIDFQA